MDWPIIRKQTSPANLADYGLARQEFSWAGARITLRWLARQGDPLEFSYADLGELRYRDQFEFDSMDFLHFVVALHKLTGVEIPESDYPRLETLASAVAYLQEQSARPVADPASPAP